MGGVFLRENSPGKLWWGEYFRGIIGGASLGWGRNFWGPVGGAYLTWFGGNFFGGEKRVPGGKSGGKFRARRDT